VQIGRAVRGDPVSWIRCVEAWKLTTRSLEVDALLPALRAIRALAEARTTQKLHVTTHSREGIAQTERFEGQLPYDPACVFHLEMMVSLASRGKQHIGETW
jgi:brefeldin A-resistance guanine nucleotide exchange factor 1